MDQACERQLSPIGFGASLLFRLQERGVEALLPTWSRDGHVGGRAFFPGPKWGVQEG